MLDTFENIVAAYERGSLDYSKAVPDLIDEVKRLREQLARALVVVHDGADFCPVNGACPDEERVTPCSVCRKKYILEGKAI